MVWQRLEYQGIMDYLGKTQGVNVIFLILSFVVVAVQAYMLGSLNFALIISKRKFSDDVRNHGSGNAGMTNMLRTYGKSAAAFTLLGDAVKAALAILIGGLFNGMIGGYVAGFFCILGHMYPIYYKFKGGKGVVTSAVMILMLDWRVFLVLLVLFLLIVASTKYMSLGSIMGILVYPLLLYRFNGPGINILFAFAIAVLVIFKHKDNIRRLLEHKENKLSFGSKKAKKDDANSASDSKA